MMEKSQSKKSPIILHHHHKLVYFFEDLDAINEKNAISFEKFENLINIKTIFNRNSYLRKRAFRSLLRKEVIIKNLDNLYYLNLENFEEYKKWYFMIAVSIFIPSLIFLLLFVAWILTAF